MQGSRVQTVHIALSSVTGIHELLHVSVTVTCCTACAETMHG